MEFIILCIYNTTHNGNFNIFPYIGWKLNISQYELALYTTKMVEQFTTWQEDIITGVTTTKSTTTTMSPFCGYVLILIFQYTFQNMCCVCSDIELISFFVLWNNGFGICLLKLPLHITHKCCKYKNLTEILPVSTTYWEQTIKMCELKDSWQQETASLNKHKVPSTTVQTVMLNRLLATANGFISTGCFRQSLPSGTHIRNYTIHLLRGNRRATEF